MGRRPWHAYYLDKLIEVHSQAVSASNTVTVPFGVRASKVFDELVGTVEAIELFGALNPTQKMATKAIFKNVIEAEYFVDFLSNNEERLAWIQEKLD